jgi:glycosyltransferase involved in cell wall biosynthesis
VNHQLAIVIPAFKSRFFDQALKSIADQSCKDFTLYIGDDASPENLYSIVKPYENKIRIIYKMFNENLGNRSLTKQWERCINLSVEEPYVWLFSDDDEMSSDAVACFYEEINRSAGFDLFRFNMNIQFVNEERILTCTYPALQSEIDFFENRINRSMYSCVSQFIFSRKAYLLNNGFVEFPLAWSSDDATWLIFSKGKGIKKIEHASITWRLTEGYNITSDPGLDKSKAKAEFLYALWFNKYFKNILNKDLLFSYTKIYLEKRMDQLKIRYMLSCFGIRSVFKLLGFKYGIWTLSYHLICRIKNKVK